MFFLALVRIHTESLIGDFERNPIACEPTYNCRSRQRIGPSYHNLRGRCAFQRNTRDIRVYIPEVDHTLEAVLADNKFGQKAATPPKKIDISKIERNR